MEARSAGASSDNAVLAHTAAVMAFPSAAADAEIPTWVDPHFHFLDPEKNPEQHATLLSAHPDLTPYLPEDYARDFAKLNVAKSVHMEVIPDDFVREVEWVQSMKAAGRCPQVGGIVCAADPSAADFADVLTACAAASDMLKGIRWILNYDGPVQPGETPTVERATWPRTVKDFLSPTDPTFASNFPLLAERGLSFDLQCNPHQLVDAAAFLAGHPGVPIVLDHIGSLRLHRGSPEEDEAMTTTWKAGMTALAALPHAHVKLSMVGYSVEGWNTDPAKEAEVVAAFRFCIDLFGTKRCSDLHKNDEFCIQVDEFCIIKKDDLNANGQACLRPTFRWTTTP